MRKGAGDGRLEPPPIALTRTMLLSLLAIAALFATLLAIPPYVRLMHRLTLGQPIRDYGPTLHEHKRGTPTMGGAVLLTVFVAGLAAYHAFIRPIAPSEWLLVVGVVALGGIGCLDDLLKMLKRHAGGVPIRYKLLLQVAILSLIWVLIGKSRIALPAIHLPFSSDLWHPSQPLAALIFIVTLMGSANAMNLTDGLDGLASGISFILLLAYGIIAATLGSQALLPLIVMMGAPLLAFLVFNVHPARLFLGDTGSTALGAFVGLLAIYTGTELVLLLLAIVPVAEAASIFLQVTSFKLTGHRIFKVSPLHHHFERAEGIDYSFLLPSVEWPEWMITLTFWGVSLLFALIGLTALLTP